VPTVADTGVNDNGDTKLDIVQNKGFDINWNPLIPNWFNCVDPLYGGNKYSGNTFTAKIKLDASSYYLNQANDWSFGYGPDYVESGLISAYYGGKEMFGQMPVENRRIAYDDAYMVVDCGGYGADECTGILRDRRYGVGGWGLVHIPNMFLSVEPYFFRDYTLYPPEPVIYPPETNTDYYYNDRIIYQTTVRGDVTYKFDNLINGTYTIQLDMIALRDAFASMSNPIDASEFWIDSGAGYTRLEIKGQDTFNVYDMVGFDRPLVLVTTVNIADRRLSIRYKDGKCLAGIQLNLTSRGNLTDKVFAVPTPSIRVQPEYCPE
jgi:hypothetical protein